MWRGVKITVPPAAGPLGAALLRTRLRIDPTGDAAVDAADDLLLEVFEAQAVAYIEGPDGIGVALMAQTWARTLSAFEPVLVLPGSPVKSVSAVHYMDIDGAWQVLDAATYRLLDGRDDAAIVPALGASWPAVAAAPDVVVVEYVLGAPTPALANAALVGVVGLLVGHYWEHREAVISGLSVAEVPLGVEAILGRQSSAGAAG